MGSPSTPVETQEISNEVKVTVEINGKTYASTRKITDTAIAVQAEYTKQEVLMGEVDVAYETIRKEVLAGG